MPLPESMLTSHYWNLLLRRRSKKTPKLRVTGLCAGNSPVNSPHTGLVTRKMFSFDDVIMPLVASKDVITWPTMRPVTAYKWLVSATDQIHLWHRTVKPLFRYDHTSNGSWCMGIKGEMSGTVCVTFTWYMYIWVVYSFCLFCCLFIIVTTQFVALYKPCKPKPKPSTYDPPPPPGQPPPGRDPKTDT